MKKTIGMVFMTLSFSGQAVTWIEVDDASKLLWQMTQDGTVFFRNLNEFDPKQSGCCYFYKLDTTTPAGRSMWSTILAKMAAQKRITLGFPDIATTGNVQTLNYIGRHNHNTNE